MARKSKANKARAVGVRRYWRRVRAIRKATGVGFKEARSLYGKLKRADLALGERAIGASAVAFIKRRPARRRQGAIFKDQRFAYFGLTDDHHTIEEKVVAALTSFPGGSNWTGAVKFNLLDKAGVVIGTLEGEVVFDVGSSDMDVWKDEYWQAGRNWIKEAFPDDDSPSGDFFIEALYVGS